jgi:hypothetical protein
MSDCELFSTKEEAAAFVRGFEAAAEMIDDDHVICQEPELTTAGEWRVDYDYLV